MVDASMDYEIRLYVVAARRCRSRASRAGYENPSENRPYHGGSEVVRKSTVCLTGSDRSLKHALWGMEAVKKPVNLATCKETPFLRTACFAERTHEGEPLAAFRQTRVRLRYLAIC